MITNSKVIYILVILLTTISCNRTLDADCPEFHSPDPIVHSLTACKNKEWKVESYTKNGQDVLSGLENCIKDNMDVYFCDHRFESVEGKIKCAIDDPYLKETGSWYFNDDTTEIEVTIGQEFFILKILELTDDKFHYISTNHNDTVETVLMPAKM